MAHRAASSAVRAHASAAVSRRARAAVGIEAAARARFRSATRSERPLSRSSRTRASTASLACQFRRRAWGRERVCVMIRRWDRGCVLV